MSHSEDIIRQSQVRKPFESRIASDQLKARVEIFQKILREKRVKKRVINVWKQ